MNKLYVPFIKTTDAELRGIEHLEENIKDNILPMFELTRSRRAKKSNPDGDIQVRLDDIARIMGQREFILDLTTNESLMNYQIEALLSDDRGFANWCDFIKSIGNRNLIPMVHAFTEGNGAEIYPQAQALMECCNRIAFRVDAYSKNISDFVDMFPDKSRLILLMDAKFIRVRTTADELPTIVDSIQRINALDELNGCVLSASSFPASVVDVGYGQDSYGDFPIEEIVLHNSVSEYLGDHNIVYGDYASIHPIKYDVKGGGWVPRVDVPLDTSLFYHRYRRDDDGYVRAASMALHDEKYENIGAWGNDQILAAANGSPNGWSPAFWISVRLNLHITRQVMRLSQA